MKDFAVVLPFLMLAVQTINASEILTQIEISRAPVEFIEAAISNSGTFNI